MDYEKKYNKALERAKNIKSKILQSHLSTESCKAVSEYIDEIIPELRESEDDRIRKKMIEHFKSKTKDTWCNMSVKSIIAWLEKKKEPNGEDEECTDFTIYHPLKNGKGKYECIPYSFYGSLTSFSEDKDLIDFLRTCFYTKEECEEWIEKQKEQKPIDNGTRGKIISRATSEKQVVLVSESSGNAEIGWDTRSLEDAKKLLEYGIAFINKQLGTKPAEWSEEDKKHINLILRVLDIQQCWDGATGKKFNPYQDEIDWLKSSRPRPSWKPSKEQMEALKSFLDYHRPIRNGSVQNWPEFNNFESLYEQLKKL